jgi:GDP-L-fucose synthase
MDVGKLKELGWAASISLRDGLQQSYQWFLANEKQARL